MLRLTLLACLVAVCLAGKYPNGKLKACCATLKDADKECVDRFCDFNAISQTSILNYMSTCQDRGPTVGQMWDCASLRHDHTKCCQEKGVDKGCMAYCAAQDGVPTNYLDYLPCFDYFNSIRDCFADHLKKNPPFKG